MKVKGIFFALLLVLSLALAGVPAKELSAQNVQRMTAEQLKDKLGSPDLAVIDVRTEGDWNSSDSKIKGALREDPSTVESWAAKYPKNQTIVLYCA